MRTGSAPEWQRFFLGLAVCVAVSIWGLVALTGTLGSAQAQENEAENDNDAAATAEEEADEANGNGDADEAPESENGEATEEEEEPGEDALADVPDGVFRTAFVNMESVIRAYPRWWANFELLQEDATDLRTQLDEEERELQRMRQQIEGTPQPTDELLRDYAQRVGLLERNARAYEAQVESEMRELSEAVYTDVYDAIEEIAEGRFDVIMGVSEREIRTGTQAEFFQKIPARAVVIHPEEYELTQQLIATMEVKSLMDRELHGEIELTAQELLQRINEEREQDGRPSLQEDLEELEMDDELEQIENLLG